MHTVFSDGSVWPDIRVQEALRDGLDAISITDHIEYQPHRDDIPHHDLNRVYILAREAAKGTDLLVVNGVEITRSMPPGHANAIFVQDANMLQDKDVMDVFRQAAAQGAFVFWNHPQWTAQREDGIATLQQIHHRLIGKGYLNGIEIYNEYSFSDEALEIALEQDLTLLANSDIHGFIDWSYDHSAGGHRPVTLVFARDRNEKALKEALFDRRTVVFFDNILAGRETYLLPLLQQSIRVERSGMAPIETIVLENLSSMDFVLENRSDYTLHDRASLFTLPAFSKTSILVKNPQKQKEITLDFAVLNAFTEPRSHPVLEIELR
jgi:hypothetical protein